MTVRRLAAKDCSQSCKILHSAKDLGLGIANYIELLMHKTLQNKKLAVLTLNSKTASISRHRTYEYIKKLTYMLIHTYVNFTIHILFLSPLHIIFEKRRLL